MRFIVEAHHPSDIHFWKFAIRELQKRGHWILVLARERDVMIDLLKDCSWIEWTVVSKVGEKNRFPVGEFLKRQCGVAYNIARYRPHAIASISGSYAQSASLFRVPNLIFSDSEHQRFNHAISHPFATKIYTPDCYIKDLGEYRKWVRYRGFHELAFLRGDKLAFSFEGIDKIIGAGINKYVPIRLSAWNTLHDVGAKGVGEVIDEILKTLEASGLRPVIVAEEGKLAKRLEKFRCALNASRYHDLLAHAAFVITEGASTASEAACMGRFAFYINTLSTGYLLHLEKAYGLVSCYKSASRALEAIRVYLENPIPEEELELKVRRLHHETIDVASFLADVLEREGEKLNPII